LATSRVKITGLDEVLKNLQALDKKVQGKVSKEALRAGAKIMLPVARQESPVKTGIMRKGIKLRMGKKRKGYVYVSILISEKTADRNYVGKLFYGAMQEFGWKTGARQGRGIRRKHKFKAPRRKIEGKHFMKKAFDAKWVQAEKAVVDTLVQGIEREASKG
jgi:HK97 gp10 family phage protein